MNIYVASSWRNERQPEVVKRLRGMGHRVYDFRNPGDSVKGFAWSDIDPEWQSWSPDRFRQVGLTSPLAALGFAADIDALETCDCCVLVNPCGRSAHLEAGYVAGADKPVVILLADGDEPELMYGMAEMLAVSMDEVVHQCNRISGKLGKRRGGYA